MSIFDEIRTFVVIEPDMPTLIRFEDDEPFRTKLDSFEQQQHHFNVNDDQILTISSKPLLRALKPFAPLGGKTIAITRTGKGYETRYKVEAVTEE